MRFPVRALLVLALASPAAALDDGPPPVPAPAPQDTPATPAGERAAEAPGAPGAEDPAGAWVAVTTGDQVRVRCGPSANYRVLDYLPKGSWVVVTATQGDYCRVRIPGGVPAFVFADLVEVREGGKAVVAKTDTLLRPTAGKEYFPLEGQKLQPGEELTVLGKETVEGGDWLRVLPPARVEYFVAASLLERVGAEGEKGEDLARIALERRDGYTGGKEAAEAREARRAREEAFARAVEAAAATRKAATAETELPAEWPAGRRALEEAMTESGDPSTRGRAAGIYRDYLARERQVEVARLRRDAATVKGDLERRLAEADARYRKALEDLLKVAPAPAAKKFAAVGTVRKEGSGEYALVKGEVVLHRIESTRYDLQEFTGKRVGVQGRTVDVDPRTRLRVLVVESLEILD